LRVHFEAIVHKISNSNYVNVQKMKDLPIFVSTLLLANLTVPAKTLEAFRFKLVIQVLRRSHLGFRHIVLGLKSDSR
jgi:hypothetical protein